MARFNLEPKMKLAITIAQSRLAAARLPAYLLLRRDPTTARAAAAAAAELRALFAVLTPDDLLRRASSMPRDGAAWLNEMAAAARELRMSLGAERQEAAQLLEADRMERHRHDVGACRLAVAAQETIDANRRTAEAPDVPLDQIRADLAAGGLDDAEVEAILARRRAEGDVLSRARTQAQAVIAEAEARAALIGRFLADPLRRLGQVPEALADEIVAATAVNDQRVADARRPVRSAGHAGAQAAQPM